MVVHSTRLIWTHKPWYCISALYTKGNGFGAVENNTVLILTIKWFDKVKVYAFNGYNSKLCETVVFLYNNESWSLY